MLEFKQVKGEDDNVNVYDRDFTLDDEDFQELDNNEVGQKEQNLRERGEIKSVIKNENIMTARQDLAKKGSPGLD